MQIQLCKALYLKDIRWCHNNSNHVYKRVSCKQNLSVKKKDNNNLSIYSLMLMPLKCWNNVGIVSAAREAKSMPKCEEATANTKVTTFVV